MKSYEILKLACAFTQNPLEDKLTAENVLTLSDKDAEAAKLYLNCLNLVISEICEQYFPLMSEETFDINNLKLNFSQFSKAPISIFSVKNTRGRKVRYKIFDKYILIFADKAKIIYSYSPEKLELMDSVDLMLPPRVLAYGVAREYFLLQGQGADADIYENRFKDALKMFVGRKSTVKIPRRRWL